MILERRAPPANNAPLSHEAAHLRACDVLLLAPTGPLSDVQRGLIVAWHMLDLAMVVH